MGVFVVLLRVRAVDFQKLLGGAVVITLEYHSDEFADKACFASCRAASTEPAVVRFVKTPRFTAS